MTFQQMYMHKLTNSQRKHRKFALFYYSSMWSLESIQNTPNPLLTLGGPYNFETPNFQKSA